MTRPLPADAPRRKRGPAPEQRQVYLKFWTSDWRADTGLRMCGFAARGLWIDMISIMAEAEPYGHLVASGRPITAQQLSRLLGAGADEIEALLAELEGANVFSRTADGVIYSRRMIRDHAKAVEGREAARRRWQDDEPGSAPRLVVHQGGREQSGPRNAPKLPNGSPNGGFPELPNGSPNGGFPELPNGSPNGPPNAYSQSPESPPLPPAGSPSPRSLRGLGGLKDWPAWKRDALRAEPGTGRLTCGAVYWDVAQQVVAEAARLPGGVAWRGNWEPLSRWLLGSGEHAARTLEDIVAAIGKRVARGDYEPPHSSLGMFDTMVWSYGTRGGR